MKDLDNLCDELNNRSDIHVVIFESSVPEFFIAHADIDMLQNLSTTQIDKSKGYINDLAKVLAKVNLLRQVTIAKIEGYARGGGHEFALACDMRFASEKAVFMQMECGMGILPCGGGSSRLARQTGLGKALEIILSAKDFDAYQAFEYGTINKVIESGKIDLYVYDLAKRISSFNLDAIYACKKTVYESIDMPILESLKNETYELFVATSKTPAVKRFKYAAKTDFQNKLNNQKNFSTLLMGLQDIN